LLVVPPVDSILLERLVRKFAESNKVARFVSANQTEGDGDKEDTAFAAFTSRTPT
jgi:hypothetical protein